MLSTLHRRNIQALFQTKESLTFSELKKIFIDTKEMNTTTLYRILDSFVSDHLIHEIHLGDERIFTLCHGHQDE
jgi:Fe2+ or Zn2+ uptake regulation protein